MRHINVKRLPEIYYKFSILLCFNLEKKQTVSVCQLISTVVVALSSDKKRGFWMLGQKILFTARNNEKYQYACVQMRM